MMRCRYCGSTSIHSATEHKNFSAGKALAGTVVFGPLGAGAGMLGKEINGFRCTQCGSFMEQPMDTVTEKMVNDAIYSARNKKSYVSYNYYKSQYPNIETVQGPEEEKSERVPVHMTQSVSIVKGIKTSEEKPIEKRTYDYHLWDPTCPVFIRKVMIRRGNSGDGISFDIVNQSKKVIRSLYLQVTVLDDTGDVITTLQCVYQGENVAPGKTFSEETMFATGSDIVYKAEVICEKAAFTDDSVWRTEEGREVFKIELPEKINTKEFPRVNYLFSAYYKLLREHLNENEENYKLYKKGLYPKILPVDYKSEGYWLCTCGMPVRSDEACPVCRCRLEELQKIFSQQYLIDIQRKTVLNRAAERAQETTEFRDSVLKELEEIKEKKYQKAIEAKGSTSITRLEEALRDLEGLEGFKDTDQVAEEYRSRIKEMKEEKQKKEKEEEEKRQEAASIREAEEKRKRKKKTIVGTIAAIFIFVIAVAGLKMYSSNPYRIIRGYILKNGEEEYAGSETKRIYIQGDDIIFGHYSSYLSASPDNDNPFWMEVWFDDSIYSKGCKADVFFDFSDVSFTIEVDNMHLYTDEGEYWSYDGDVNIDGTIDISKFDYINYDDAVQIKSVRLEEEHDNSDNLYDFLDEQESNPYVKGIGNDLACLTAATLEKALDEWNINVSMEDLGYTSLKKSGRDSSGAIKNRQMDDSQNKETEAQGERSPYKICKEELMETGERRTDDFLDGYEYVLPAGNASEDSLRGAIAVTEDSDDLYVLFEYRGKEESAIGYRWKVRLDGEKGVYELHLPCTIDKKIVFADVTGSFELSTYDKTATYTADKVTMEEGADIDVSSIEGVRTYPTSMIISSVNALFYWLNYSKVGVSIEELGF